MLRRTPGHDASGGGHGAVDQPLAKFKSNKQFIELIAGTKLMDD